MKFEYFITTLNEEKNIKECVDSIKNVGGQNITVLDGGSTDKTKEISNKFNINFLSFPKSSLSFRKAYAIDKSEAEYVVFVDADQRLINYDYDLEHVIDQYFIDDDKLSGLVFTKISPNNSNYWERGFGLRQIICNGTGSPQKVIGTPTVFKAKYGKEVNFNSNLKGSADDTVFCNRLVDSGYILRSMPENAIELVRSSFTDTVKKAFWYGNGDSEYIRLYKEKRLNHLFHVLVRLTIIHPLTVLFKEPSLVIFFIIFGISRLYGMIYGFIVKKDLSSLKS